MRSVPGVHTILVAVLGSMRVRAAPSCQMSIDALTRIG
jgi:hypothetical protein